MKDKKSKRIRQKIRHRRVRAKIAGTEKCPRLAVFRSSRHIYAQLIDDQNQKTLAQSNDLFLGFKKSKSRGQTGGEKGTAAKINLAKNVGRALGQMVLEKGLSQIVFDRGGYKYHGRVKALAEGLREVGVKF